MIGFKLNIFIIPHHPIGGAERVHLQIIKALPIKPIVLLDYSKTNVISKEFENNAYCFLINSKKRRKYALFFLKFVSAISSVTLFGCNSATFYTFISHLKNKVKTIDLTHAFSAPENGIEQFSLPYVALIDKRIVINQKTANDYKKLYQLHQIPENLLNRFVLIPNATSIFRFDESKIEKRWDNFVVGFVGRNSPEKRPELFFEIIKEIKPKAKIIGDDFSFYKKDFPEVIYFENCNDAETIRSQFSEISVLLVTSNREGFPLVIMEAMELGIPVIATNVGSIAEHVIDFENGFLAPSNFNLCKDFMLDKIQLLASDTILYKKMSVNARNYAVANFDLTAFNTSYTKLFYE